MPVGLPPKQFAAALGALSGRLSGLARTASDGLIDGMESIAEQAVERLKERTPRSEEAGDHIADGWVSREADAPGPGRFEVEIVNIEPRALAPIPVKGGGETNLLTILEYGSKPHEIEPVNAQALHFTTGGGAEIFAAHVEHPGTQPYAMIATTAVEVALDMKRLIDATRTALTLRASGSPR